ACEPLPAGSLDAARLLSPSAVETWRSMPPPRNGPPSDTTPARDLIVFGSVRNRDRAVAGTLLSYRIDRTAPGASRARGRWAPCAARLGPWRLVHERPFSTGLGRHAGLRCRPAARAGARQRRGADLHRLGARRRGRWLARPRHARASRCGGGAPGYLV